VAGDTAGNDRAAKYGGGFLGRATRPQQGHVPIFSFDGVPCDNILTDIVVLEKPKSPPSRPQRVYEIFGALHHLPQTLPRLGGLKWAQEHKVSCTAKE
jgi:hypothetical protein